MTGGGEREVKSRSGDRGGSAVSSVTVLNGWFYLWDAVPLPALLSNTERAPKLCYNAILTGQIKLAIDGNSSGTAAKKEILKRSLLCFYSIRIRILLT